MYLDGTFAFGLAAISAVPLRVGQLLTQTEIDSLKGADLEEKAKEVALRFIEYRPRSTAETRQHLLKKEYPEDVVERVIERLTAVELLNDAAFASYWVEQRQTFKPRSQLAIQQELRQKGVERQAIDDALQSVDEVTAATRAAEPAVDPKSIEPALRNSSALLEPADCTQTILIPSFSNSFSSRPFSFRMMETGL